MHPRVNARHRSIVALATIALAAGAACSEDGESDPAPALANPPAPPAASAGAGAGGEAPPDTTPAPAPSAAGAPGETNPEPAGPVSGEPPPASAGATESDPVAAAPDAGVVGDIPAPACPREQTDANVATVTAAIDELFVQGDIGAVDRYWGEPYLQHNPIAASGVATFRNLFGGLVSPGNPIYEPSRTIGECELVLIHGNYLGGGPTFDMFRVQNARIVEHWDAFASGAGPNPSGHTALDGPTTVQDIELSAQNEALALEFVDRVLIGGALDALGDYMSPDLIEHDPQGQDGSAAYLQNLQQNALSYRQVHHDIADGNFVFILSEGLANGTDVAHYDLFRVENSLIVEHWNARRDVPATTASGLGIF